MTVFYGYPGRVWSVVLTSVNNLVAALEVTSTPADVIPLAGTVLATALNGLSALNANRISQFWQGEAQTLAQLQTLALSVDAEHRTYYMNRLAALEQAAVALQALVPTISLTGINTALSQGKAAIPDPGVLEFYEGFSLETPPAGLTTSNLPTYAAQCASVFADLALDVKGLAGYGFTYLYDQLNRFSIEMNAFAELFNDFFYGFAAPSASSLWNLLFTLPTMLMHADLLSSAPNSIGSQQDQLIRYLLVKVIQQVELFILTTARPVTTQIQQATVRAGDSLMDVAARSLGDFEQWAAIAKLNNLSPPFTGGGIPTPGLATWGSKVMVPFPGANQVPPSEARQHINTGLACSCYLTNFLGVDIYIGPINGDMPPWRGDFEVISGFNNLRWALGRRMQTTLGSLIYHSDYGSRIPPEVGAVQHKDELGLIAAFGKSCLLSDPRVASVISATAISLPNFAVEFNGVVVPGGFPNAPVTVNEVVNAGITPATVAQS